MPTYVYRFVDTGETIEVQQSFSDDALTEYAHPESGEVMSVKKVFQPVGVTFKGSGFFKTDSRASSSKTSSNGASASSGDSSSDASSDGSSGSSGDSSSKTSEKKNGSPSVSPATTGSTD